MPLIISKNTMRYDADQAEAQKQYTTSADIGVTAAAPYSLQPAFTFPVEDKCHNCRAELSYTMPAVTSSQQDCLSFVLVCTSAEGTSELAMDGQKGARGGTSGFMRGFVGSIQPLTSVHIEVRCTGSFTIPSGSAFNASVRCNDSALMVHPVTGPAPAPPASYAAAPQSLDAANIDPRDPHRIYFYKGDNFWIFNMDTEAQAQGATAITTLLSHYTPGDYLKWAFRNHPTGTNAAGEDEYNRLATLSNSGLEVTYSRANADSNYVFVSSTTNNATDQTAHGSFDGSMPLVQFREAMGQFQVKIIHPHFEAYGPGTSVFPTLPAAQVDACVYDKGNGYAIAFQGSTMYKLNTTTKTVISSHPFGYS